MYVSTLNTEQWKPVYQHDNCWRELFGEDELSHYEISSLGRLRSHGTIVKPEVDAGGYFYIRINDLYRGIHRLVAEAFLWDSVRKKSRRENVHHKNENKQDNSVSNLMFCSKAQHKQIHNKQLAERMLARLNDTDDKFAYYKQMLVESEYKLARLNQFN